MDDNTIALIQIVAIGVIAYWIAKMIGFWPYVIGFGIFFVIMFIRQIRAGN